MPRELPTFLSPLVLIFGFCVVVELLGFLVRHFLKEVECGSMSFPAANFIFDLLRSFFHPAIRTNSVSEEPKAKSDKAPVGSAYRDKGDRSRVLV